MLNFSMVVQLPYSIYIYNLHCVVLHAHLSFIVLLLVAKKAKKAVQF